MASCVNYAWTIKDYTAKQLKNRSTSLGEVSSILLHVFDYYYCLCRRSCKECSQSYRSHGRTKYLVSMQVT